MSNTKRVTPLVGHVFDAWLDMRRNIMRAYKFDEQAENRLRKFGKQVFGQTIEETLSLGLDIKFITLLFRESNIPGDPLHNQWINQCGESSRSIYVPSKYYLLSNIKENIHIRPHRREEHEEVPECAICVYKPHPSVTKNLISVLQNISEWQKISDLYIEGLHCDHETEANIFNLHQNTRSVILTDCILPQNVTEHILKQLPQCNQLIGLDVKMPLRAAGCHLVESIRSWGHDPPLQRLGLGDCKMPEDVCGALVKGLSTCKQLTILSLSGNTLGAAGCHLVESIRSWGHDPPLQWLGLGDCKMPEDVCGALVKGLSTCKQLAHLDLKGNTLGAAGCHLVESIRSWGHDPPLQQLYLEDCKMPEDVCGALVKGLSTCKQLTDLILSGNTLGAAGCHLVESIRSWGHDPPLQWLGLGDCKIPEDVCGALVKGLSTCKQLAHLHLKGNTLGAAGCHLVESIRSWGHDPPLQQLYLEDCKMPEDVCGALVKGLSTCKQLTDLILSGNTLGAAGCHLVESIRSWGT